MKNILMIIAILISGATNAQVTKVYLQASGLTCSMCSNSINKALSTLDFIDKVDADIQHYTFEISFKMNSCVDFDKIRRKVEDAGFSVSGFVAAIDFNNVEIKENEPVTIGSNTLIFVNGKSGMLVGVKQVRLLDKGFITSKEYRRNVFPVSLPGILHVKM